MSRIVPISELKQISEAFDQGQVIALPTDTVYGLSCSFSNSKAAQKIQQLKGRENHQFIGLVASVAQAESLVQLTAENLRVLKQYWPGAITFIMNGRHSPTVAVRCPALPWLEELLRLTGPLISTSCNPTTLPPARSVAECQHYFPSLTMFVDGGPSPDSPPSTLVNLTKTPYEVVRKGPVKFSCER